jgi:hypothetical protein
MVRTAVFGRVLAATLPLAMSPFATSTTVSCQVMAWTLHSSASYLLGVSENSDETPEYELKESQNVQVHR